MKKIPVTLIARNRNVEHEWLDTWKKLTLGISEVEMNSGLSEIESHGVIVLDSQYPDQNKIFEIASEKDCKVIIAQSEKEVWPESVENGLAEGVVIYPFRAAEIFSLFRNLMDPGVQEVSSHLSKITDGFQEVLDLAERLQKQKFPKRFQQIRGFEVTNRYLAGMRSGGDFFDIAESQDGNLLSVIMSDSSSYGLSSSVISALMSLGMKLSKDDVKSCFQVVETIFQEVRPALREVDHLSLFYGVISKKDLSFRYVHFGTCGVFHSKEGADFVELKSHGKVLRAADLSVRSRSEGLQEGKVMLHPKDRLAFLSDGYFEVVGGKDQALKLLNEFKSKTSVDSVNEFLFNVKSKLTSSDDLPPQDCTSVLFDVNEKFLRLQA